MDPAELLRKRCEENGWRFNIFESGESVVIDGPVEDSAKVAEAIAEYKRGGNERGKAQTD